MKKMTGVKNLFLVIIIGMYVNICIWIYYCKNTSLTTMGTTDEISNVLNEDELMFAYVVCKILFYSTDL